MEAVFITIHDLSEDAQIRYCSDSIEDILGYVPSEVLGRSCWDYFHPDEIPFARKVHGRGVSLDKASVLNYCRVRHKDGSWIGCECVFTVVYDVLVASTSIYTIGPKARERELASGAIRRIFSSSPRDPRYHMLSYLSNKFSQDPYQDAHFLEPRAALFLNRFTRTSTVMYATNGVVDILGLQPNQLAGKSFYYCIEENCLPDAVKTIESAKANDSIAYLRFWFRDPTQDASRAHSEAVSVHESDEDEEGGVALRDGARSGSNVSMNGESTPRTISGQPTIADGQQSSEGLSTSVPQADAANVTASNAPPPLVPQTSNASSLQPPSDVNHRASSGNSTDMEANAPEAIFDRVASHNSSVSEPPPEERIEIEAVVSCTSDGLVVILRRAHSITPPALGVTEVAQYPNGLFASPWAPDPILPASIRQNTATPLSSIGSGPVSDDTGLMATIRDVAVFAWGLTGINGSLRDCGVGNPSGEALPPGGLPIWDPNSNADPYNLFNGFSGSLHRPFRGMGEPYRPPKNDGDLTSSDDEVVFKRSPVQSAWRRPKRRGQDAFGADGSETGDGENKDGGRKRATRSQSGSGVHSASGSGCASQSGAGSGSA
ncbi:uncharacterized protein A1O9_04603 [Exophiala aquamarina CBS 119918]|uniref:PAS domain-containing protein n=1 Tax=Exophiala aquamarina CBS 119918 TaxID=1182545 RepID=A0A072PW20_9EURO|nr:uncharacterized protein A1O9_04603 [Exophiala aquamarina CBS 119918]KEF59755.1 hypothetical protein A1O9_04603 [Exophiala aquamarina CBS 119918]